MRGRWGSAGEARQVRLGRWSSAAYSCGMGANGFARTDRALAQRLERAEAASNASFVEARARLHSGSGACWREVSGTYAMFDGVDSPITQTFGLGMFAPLAGADLDAIEDFFADRERARPTRSVRCRTRRTSRSCRPAATARSS